MSLMSERMVKSAKRNKSMKNLTRSTECRMSRVTPTAKFQKRYLATSIILTIFHAYLIFWLRTAFKFLKLSPE